MAKERLVSPATVAELLFEVLPIPTTGSPVAASVTVNFTTGAPEMAPLRMVPCGTIAAHTAGAASVGGTELRGSLMTVCFGGPGGPASPDGPGGPGGPAGPAGPVQPAPRASARTNSGAKRTRACMGPSCLPRSSV